MFQSRIFVRIISKNREAYLLKIITLAIAFACSTLIILFSFNEFGYDHFHKDSKSIFRVLQRNNREDFSGNRLSVKIPPSAYSRLASAGRDSITIARVKIMNGVSVVSQQPIHDKKVHAADSSLLDVFSFTSMDGNLESFRAQKNAALLSEKAALQFFGTIYASGKSFDIYTLRDTLSYHVAAVFQNFPSNTHEAFEVFIPFDSTRLKALSFNPDEFGVYGKLHADNPLAIESTLRSPEMSYRLQPIPEIYFGPRVIGEDAKHGDEYSVLILICITGLILFLAVTNYINLTTLTLPHRSKELAIKKLSGTGQSELLLAFAKESLALVGLSLGLGIGLILGITPWIESLLSINVFKIFVTGDFLLISILFSLLIIVGLAPLLMVYKFAHATPTRLLSTETISFPRFKRVITLLQLGISIFLIVASIVIRRQVNYSLVKEPGRNHYQVVYLNFPSDYTNESLSDLRAHWKRNNPNIQDVMATSQLPNRIQSKELDSDLYFMTVDRGFLDFFDLNTQEGRWFQANDNAPKVVVNAAASDFALNHEGLGIIENMGEQFNQPQKPIEYRLASQANYNFLCVRILEVNIRRTVTYLSEYFTSPDSPLQVSFMDKRFEEWLLYQNRLNKLSEILAIISGLLSCCAIYGLSLSMVRDKLKQIAIHKLFGANTTRITTLLVREFLIQMGFALLFFGPFTFIFLKEFLRNFVYATQFEWMDSIYPLAYCGVVIIVICGFQVLGLNRADLTKVLKG
jgi:putative ABC transport system permease protein